MFSQDRYILNKLVLSWSEGSVELRGLSMTSQIANAGSGLVCTATVAGPEGPGSGTIVPADTALPAYGTAVDVYLGYSANDSDSGDSVPLLSGWVLSTNIAENNMIRAYASTVEINIGVGPEFLANAYCPGTVRISPSKSPNGDLLSSAILNQNSEKKRQICRKYTSGGDTLDYVGFLCEVLDHLNDGGSSTGDDRPTKIRDILETGWPKLQLGVQSTSLFEFLQKDYNRLVMGLTGKDPWSLFTESLRAFYLTTTPVVIAGDASSEGSGNASFVKYRVIPNMTNIKPTSGLQITSKDLLGYSGITTSRHIGKLQTIAIAYRQIGGGSSTKLSEHFAVTAESSGDGIQLTERVLQLRDQPLEDGNRLGQLIRGELPLWAWRLPNPDTTSEDSGMKKLARAMAYSHICANFGLNQTMTCELHFHKALELLSSLGDILTVIIDHNSQQGKSKTLYGKVAGITIRINLEGVDFSVTGSVTLAGVLTEDETGLQVDPYDFILAK